MTEDAADLVYYYRDAPEEPFFKEGVTQGWLVNWTGEPGPAKMLKVVALVDGDGFVSVEQNGEWVDTTVTDDR